MAHEILAVKLCELDDQFARLSSRIHLSETADRGRLRQEIRALRGECAETERTLQRKLRLSRAEIAPVLSDGYEEVARTMRKTASALEEQASGCAGAEAAAEEKILLAEYALDFALQGASRALLLAMEAIDAQYTEREGDRKTS